MMVNRESWQGPGAGENAHLSPVKQEAVYGSLTWPCTESSKYRRKSSRGRGHTHGPRRPARTPIVTKTKQAVCCLLKLPHSATSSIAQSWGSGERAPEETTQLFLASPGAVLTGMLPCCLTSCRMCCSIKSRLGTPCVLCFLSDPVTPDSQVGWCMTRKTKTSRRAKSHSSLLLQLFSKSAMIVTNVTGKFITSL